MKNNCRIKNDSRMIAILQCILHVYMRNEAVFMFAFHWNKHASIFSTFSHAHLLLIEFLYSLTRHLLFLCHHLHRPPLGCVATARECESSCSKTMWPPAFVRKVCFCVRMSRNLWEKKSARSLLSFRSQQGGFVRVLPTTDESPCRVVHRGSHPAM